MNKKKKDQLSQTKSNCSTWRDLIQNRGVLPNQQAICFKPIGIRWSIKIAGYQRHTFYMLSPWYKKYTSASSYLSLCISQLNHFSVAWPSLDLTVRDTNHLVQRYLSSHHVLCSINIRNILTVCLHELSVRTATCTPSNTQ